MANPIKIGLTMRETQARGYFEPRDALAGDWIDFMAWALPGAMWMPLPNAGEPAVELCRQWGLNALVFTGGDTPGTSPRRDKTERALIRHGLETGIPLFGVCRGLQVFQWYFGKGLEPVDETAHKAARHEVRLLPCTKLGMESPGQRQVNSYHRFGVKKDGLAPELSAFALSADGVVEGVVARNHALAAIQWHPEREDPFQDFDRDLIRIFLGLK